MNDAPYRGSAMKRGGQARVARLLRRTGYEGSPADVAEDRRGAKALGVSQAAYEGTARDRREDKAGAKRAHRQAGGKVSDDQLGETYARSKHTGEDLDRYEAARNAQVSAMANERGLTKVLGSSRLGSGRDVTLGRADYPGFSKGGRVKR